MRNMSFALTADQITNGTKYVTRRLGWMHLKAGDWIQPVLKGMGLKKGEKVTKLRDPIRVKRVSFQQLDRMTSNPNYGIIECKAEGFPNMTPKEFVEMFCKTHKGCKPDWCVTRIEFEI